MPPMMNWILNEKKFVSIIAILTLTMITAIVVKIN